MGFLNSLVGKLLGTESKEPDKPPSNDMLGITITYSGSTQPAVVVSDAEVATAAERHAFVLANELTPLKTADQWFEEATQKRRLRDGSERAYEWLLPFLPLDVAKFDQLKPFLTWGPNSASGIAKELRALIRERRKAKQPWSDLLSAMYGACVMADFTASLEFEGRQPHSMTQYVDTHDLQGIRIDYAVMGYQCIEALGKTDVKWLVEAFGEPAEHQSFDALWPHIRRNAISRHCWEELRSANKPAQSLGLPQKTMREWLRELVKRNIGYHKEWLERVAAREVQDAEKKADLDAAWAATLIPFAVADIETTGLKCESDEVIELAAVLVEPDGTVTAEFSMLVRPQNPVPAEITQLTGITQTDVGALGQPLPQALSAFLEHVGERPVFFHNAPFDQGFLARAATLTKLKFRNKVHDTLPLARQAWPSLGTYKLGMLAEHVGAAAPSHRALGDAKATLAVLLAARSKLAS